MCKIQVLLVFVTVVVAACGAAQDDDSLLNYTQTAERQFRDAMDEFEDKDCVSAERLFKRLRKKFPYSRYAVLADLRLADCQYIQGNYAEAAVQYQQFVKVHPTHEDAHYAAYRSGLSYYELMPGDFVVMPPSHEREQASVRDARAALSGFLSKYPDSPWFEKAKKQFQEVENALVRHEMYVAEFYLRHDDKRAAVVRLEGIQNEYPKSTLVPDAMLLQAVTFVEMNNQREAERVLRAIIDLYPDHHQSLRARDFLKHLGREQGGAERGEDG
ncbi:MAG: outer membrane protein assembly factor BamD [Myxococcota bacterium]|nr:outer membrane protein assembly factor BamD [Myxococcota bacterium]